MVQKLKDVCHLVEELKSVPLGEAWRGKVARGGVYHTICSPVQEGTDGKHGGAETERCLSPCRGTQVSTPGENLGR